MTVTEPTMTIRKATEEEIRIWRESDEARKRRYWRMEEEYPRVKAEHPDMWVAFGDDGFITASDDMFALIVEYEKMGYSGDEVLIEFTYVSTESFFGGPS